MEKKANHSSKALPETSLVPQEWNLSESDRKFLRSLNISPE